MSGAIVTTLPRVFKYGSLTLEDPDCSMTPAAVKDFYADIYPELTQAAVEGPKYEDDGTEVWEFEKKVGTKGHTVSDAATGKALFENGLFVPGHTRHLALGKAAHDPHRKDNQDILSFHSDVARAINMDGEALTAPSEALGMV